MEYWIVLTGIMVVLIILDAIFQWNWIIGTSSKDFGKIFFVLGILLVYMAYVLFQKKFTALPDWCYVLSYFYLILGFGMIVFSIARVFYNRLK